jgi:iron complex outermembrane receptor protein
MKKIRAAYCLGLFLAASPAALTSLRAAENGAAANAGTADSLGEIIVTAQKRAESVQSVPLSITVLPSEELARQGVQTIVDLSRMSAALEFTAPAAAPGGGAFIRGIGTESVGGLTATASVSVVLDGVVLGNTNVTDIFDVSRVEVLKGPQGTLFGSSVSAGVISLVTNAPDPTAMSSTVSAEYGAGDLGSQYDRRSLRATVNLPLSSDSALRVSLHSDDNSGVFYNPYENLRSDEPDIGARVRYLIKPSEALTLNVIADYNRYYNTGVPVLTYRAAPVPQLAAALSACGVTASTSNFDTCSQYYNTRSQTDRGLSFQFDYDLDFATLTSISAYRLGDTASRGDIEAIPLSISQQYLSTCHFFDCVPIFAILPGKINELQTQGRQLYSEELRLASSGKGPLQWVGGVFYQHYKLADNEPGTINAFFTGGNFVDTSFKAATGSQDYAGFGNLTYNVTDSTRLIGGARYTHSTVHESKYSPSNTNDNVTYSLAASASKVSWRVGAQQDLPTHTMLYATVSTGYKSPEISDALAPNPNPGQPWNGGMYVVRPELPTAYELGVKQSFLDDRLAVDADVFYEHVKDYQGQACSPGTGGSSGVIVCSASNVPTVNSKGFELDIFGRPVKGLTVNLSGIYNPATYPAGFLGTDGSQLGGHQLNYGSKTKVTLSAEETVPVSTDYSIVIGADYTYRSEQSLYTSGLSQFVAPSSNIFNARLGLASSKNWSAYIFGRNLGSSHFPRQIYPTPFATGGLWQVYDANDKRLVGLQMQAKF